MLILINSIEILISVVCHQQFGQHPAKHQATYLSIYYKFGTTRIESSQSYDNLLNQKFSSAKQPRRYLLNLNKLPEILKRIPKFKTEKEEKG